MKTNTRKRMTTARASVAVVALATVGAVSMACGSEDGSTRTGIPAGAFLVSTTQFLPDGARTNVVAFDSLQAGTEVDYDGGLELGGVPNIFAYHDGRAFGLGLGEEPTIVRYDIEGDELVESGRLSLANYGLSSAFNRAGLVPVFDAERAWFIDQGTRTVIVWNPTTMTAESSFPIDGIEQDGGSPDFEYYPVRRGDELLLAMRYRDIDAGTWLPRSAVAVLDIEESRVKDVATTDRCGDFLHSMVAANGDIYYASGNLGTAAQLVLGDASGLTEPPCMLRIRAGNTQFDPDFYVPLSDLAAGMPAGLLVPGQDDVAYIKGLDTTMIDLESATDYRADVWRQPAWRWFRIELGATTGGELIESFPPSLGSGTEVRVGGVSYITAVSDDGADTTLVEFGPDDAPVEHITVRGFPYNVLSLR